MASAGVPVLLLREAEEHVVSVELKNGEVYRGNLERAEDSMSMQLSSVVHVAVDGRVTKLENVYLRGNHIRFVVLPEILKNAPLFKKVADFASAKAKAKAKPAGGTGKKKAAPGGKKGKGGGAGRAAAAAAGAAGGK